MTWKVVRDFLSRWDLWIFVEQSEEEIDIDEPWRGCH